VVLMDDNPSKIALAISIARHTLSIARQNVWFAIGVKVAVLILATFGLATMWLAVFADVGVTILAVLNAMRALGESPKQLAKKKNPIARFFSIITNKQKRKAWYRAYRLWARRPHEVAPLSDATHECASCSTVYQGNFCPRCGQSAKIGRFSFKKAFLLFLDVWGMGNRGMFRSIRDLILRPGYMIRDYLRGMQSAYFPPFKMFFLLTALSYVVEHGVNLNTDETKEKTEKSISSKHVKKDITVLQNDEEAREDLKDNSFAQGIADGLKVEVNGEEKEVDKEVEKEISKKLKQAETLKDFLMNLRERNSSLFSLLFLLLFCSPLYLFLRHSPSIPDFRFSEFIVALVYTSNAYSIYSIAGSLLDSSILDIMAVLITFVSLKQLSGYSKRRVLGYITLTFIMSFILLVILFISAVFVLDYIQKTVA
jgi:hypothetical protein